MDRARGVRDSAIFGLFESLGMSGFEKVYSLFGVTECLGKYIEFVMPDCLFSDDLAFFVFPWIFFDIVEGYEGKM